MKYQKDRPYSETLEEAEKWNEWLNDPATDGGETIRGEDVAGWAKQQAARERQTGSTATGAADAKMLSDRSPE
jgi:hypothetical protein